MRLFDEFSNTVCRRLNVFSMAKKSRDRDLQLADASCHGQFFDRLYGSYTVNTAGQASLVMLASWSINWLICGTLESSKA